MPSRTIASTSRGCDIAIASGIFNIWPSRFIDVFCRPDLRTTYPFAFGYILPESGIVARYVRRFAELAALSGPDKLIWPTRTLTKPSR
jgi:hypothetical protein